jgi:hypothetical protein
VTDENKVITPDVPQWKPQRREKLPDGALFWCTKSGCTGAVCLNALEELACATCGTAYRI